MLGFFAVICFIGSCICLAYKQNTLKKALLATTWSITSLGLQAGLFVHIYLRGDSQIALGYLLGVIFVHLFLTLIQLLNLVPDQRYLPRSLQSIH